MSVRPLPIILLALLLAPANARAAEQLLDTITVPANSSTIVQGTYQLKAGTRYVLEVSGTMKSTNTDGGYGHGYDALYCYEEYVVQSTSCADARKDPSNRTLRAHDVHYSTGAAEDWRLPDQFTSTSKPATDTPAVDYDPNHTYVVGFYPPVSGPIKARTYYAYTGGCPGCTNSTTGSFTVKIYGEPPAGTTPAPSPTPAPGASQPPPVACASASQLIARAAACDETCIACKKFGTTALLPVPKPNMPIDVGGVTISPEAKQILFEAGIEDAETQNLIATLIIQAKAQRLRDQFWGCLYIGNLAPDPYQQPWDHSPKNPVKFPAMIQACSKLIAKEAEKEAAGKPVAVASQAGCKMLFFPIYRNRKESRSPMRRKQINSAARRSLDGGCAVQGGKMSFRVGSRRKGVPLYRLTGRKPGARLVRVARKGTPTPAGSKLYVRWRNP